MARDDSSHTDILFVPSREKKSVSRVGRLARAAQVSKIPLDPAMDLVPDKPQGLMH